MPLSQSISNSLPKRPSPTPSYRPVVFRAVSYLPQDLLVPLTCNAAVVDSAVHP